MYIYINLQHTLEFTFTFKPNVYTSDHILIYNVIDYIITLDYIEDQIEELLSYYQPVTATYINQSALTSEMMITMIIYGYDARNNSLARERVIITHHIISSSYS